MGTKRPFDEDLQEFIKHPKHLDHGNKHVPFEEYKHSLEPSHNYGITGEDNATFFQTIKPEKPNSVSEMVNEFETSGPVFPSNIFPEFFEFTMPRRQLVHHDDTYSSLLNNSPRKQVPIGPDHQADVPDLDPNFTKTLNLTDSQDKGTIVNSPVNESPEYKCECQCLDSGSIRCVQQHINEVRLNLQNTLGLEKFTELGLHEMGEQVSDKWTDEEQQLFQDVIYSNPVSLGRKFWEQLSIAFNSRTKKELVSYYFNVFMLRRRAVQNRSNLLEIDSDDDEWWGSKRGPTSPEQEFVVVGPFGEDEDIHEEREREREEEEKVNVRSESYLHWDPPYSTMGLTKGVDLLPTCSMIEEIFGSSNKGKSS